MHKLRLTSRYSYAHKNHAHSGPSANEQGRGELYLSLNGRGHKLEVRTCYASVPTYLLFLLLFHERASLLLFVYTQIPEVPLSRRLSLGSLWATGSGLAILPISLSC
jgi:hypothetical protein